MHSAFLNVIRRDLQAYFFSKSSLRPTRWQHGIIQRRVFDGRTKRSGLQCNFYVWYEVDDEEEPTALRLEEYDGDDDCAWVLLEAVADGA